MRNKILVIFSLMILQSNLFGQSNSAYFGFGGLYNSFQDARFTDVQYNKFVVNPELGYFSFNDSRIIHAHANGYIIQDSHPADTSIAITTLGYNVRGSYLKNVADGLYFGGTWDILDYWRKDIAGLDNGAQSFKVSSDLYVSGNYIKTHSNNITFILGLDYGVFSMINTMPSFSANIPQRPIERGEVKFIDEEVRRPWLLGNFQGKSFWNAVNIRTSAELRYKKHFSISYVWDMKRYRDIVKYPVTNAFHSIKLRYRFLNN